MKLVWPRTLRRKNPFRKIEVEKISISPQFAKYDSNFIETKKYTTRWIYEYGPELAIKWGLLLNPIAWLLFMSFVAWCKLKGKNWREVIRE